MNSRRDAGKSGTVRNGTERNGTEPEVVISVPRLEKLLILRIVK